MRSRALSRKLSALKVINMIIENEISILDLMIDIRRAFAQPIKDQSRANELMDQFKERTKDLSQDQIRKLNMRSHIRSWQQQGA